MIVFSLFTFGEFFFLQLLCLVHVWFASIVVVVVCVRVVLVGVLHDYIVMRVNSCVHVRVMFDFAGVLGIWRVDQDLLQVLCRQPRFAFG